MTKIKLLKKMNHVITHAGMKRLVNALKNFENDDIFKFKFHDNEQIHVMHKFMREIVNSQNDDYDNEIDDVEICNVCYDNDDYIDLRNRGAFCEIIAKNPAHVSCLIDALKHVVDLNFEFYDIEFDETFDVDDIDIFELLNQFDELRSMLFQKLQKLKMHNSMNAVLEIDIHDLHDIMYAESQS